MEQNLQGVGRAGIGGEENQRSPPQQDLLIWVKFIPAFKLIKKFLRFTCDDLPKLHPSKVDINKKTGSR